MGMHESKLRARAQVAQGTMAFHFNKPAGFVFEPGQAIDLVLPGSTAADPQSGRHTFSIVSAPFEADLMIATRMRDSEFKRTLGALPIGAGVTIEGPTGELVLHAERARAAVFIAGGIGVTPFVSMLRQAAQDALQQDLVLLYANRRPEDAAFLAELQALERRNPRFRLRPTMTQMIKSSQAWDGLRGPVDENLIAQAVQGLPQPIHYLAGPPAMVESMRLTLNEAGIDDSDIRSEEFYGY